MIEFLLVCKYKHVQNVFSFFFSFKVKNDKKLLDDKNIH